MKFIVALLLVTLGTIAVAQFRIEKSVVCDSTDAVVAQLTSERYSEQTAWLGSSKDGTYYALFTNPETGSWTFIQFNDELACVLGVGSKHVAAPLGTSI
jgi:hypothetical protein